MKVSKIVRAKKLMSMILGCSCKDKRNLRARKVLYFLRNKLLPERISSKLGIFQYHITASYGILLCVSRVYSLRGKRLKGKGKGISDAQEPREKGGYCPNFNLFHQLGTRSSDILPSLDDRVSRVSPLRSCFRKTMEKQYKK